MPVRMATMKKKKKKPNKQTRNNKCWQEYREKGTLVHS